MTSTEYGYLLLCCDTGNGEQPLSNAQMQQLRLRMQAAPQPVQPQRDITQDDLIRLGYDAPQAAHLLHLLSRQVQLDEYLRLGRERGFYPLCRVSEQFPQALRQKLGSLCPNVLFYCGDLSLLQTECVSLVGSRKLSGAGAGFAGRVGKLAAREKLTLVSGGAVGADNAAAGACRAAGGCVIVFPAQALCEFSSGVGMLVLSEGGWHLPFSTTRALTRNRYIHALGSKVLVAQSAVGTGGTWRGTSENLQNGWTPVFVRSDGSLGAKELIRLGAEPVEPFFESLRALTPRQFRF